MTAPPRWKGLLRWALRLGGTVLFSWFVLRRIDIGQAAAVLADAAWAWVVVATAALFPVTMLLWARRWHLLLRAFGIRYAFARVVRLNLIGLFLGFVVADSVGGFVKLVYLRAEGHSMPRAVAATVVDKGFELAMLVAFGLTGFAVFRGVAPAVEAAVAVWLAAGAVGLVALWAVRRPLLNAVARGLTRVVSRRAAHYVDEAPGRVADALRQIPPAGWLHLIALSVAVRLAHFAIAYALALGLHIPISYGQVAAVMSIVGIVLAVPVSVGGLGTREATLVVLFGLLGLAAEQAVALALLLFLYQLPWRALGLFLWWRNPLGARTLSAASSVS